MSVLVTGGAGYIGSHLVWGLLDRGEQVVALDDLSTGDPGAIPADILVRGSAGDRALVQRLLQAHGVDAVIHAAGSVSVPDSFRDPLAYYANNTAQSVDLIQACAGRVAGLVFSSTAAVYAPPTDGGRVSESAPLLPLSPYGRSKAMVEQVLADMDAAGAMRSVRLRYFNVAGCDPAGRTGLPRGGAHLLTAACEAALGTREALEVFGDDYATGDGTCVRDYIHVADLVDAHVRAVDHLRKGRESLVLNCGYGRGVSVREVIAAVEAVTGRPLPCRQRPRRAGDLAAVVADCRAIEDHFGWTPRHAELDGMIRSMLAWLGRP